MALAENLRDTPSNTSPNLVNQHFPTQKKVAIWGGTRYARYILSIFIHLNKRYIWPCHQEQHANDELEMRPQEEVCETCPSPGRIPSESKWMHQTMMEFDHAKS